MWGNQQQWFSVLIQSIWVIHETVAIQTHYHQSTLPTTPRANALVEKSVRTVNNLLTIAKQCNYDPYLGLLEYRNTPIDQVGSPAQLLMSRRPRSIIPTTEAQLQLRVQDPNKVKEKLRLKQEKQRYYFDQHTKQLTVWKKGDESGHAWESVGNHGW